MNEFISYIKNEISLIQKYVEETKSSISLISPNTIGKIADNINKIDILLADSKGTILEKAKRINEVKNIIMSCIDEVKSESVMKNVLVGRSFTYVSDIKNLRQKIDSIGELTKLYDSVIAELLTELNIDNKEKADQFVDEIAADKSPTAIDLLMKNIDNKYLDFIKVGQIIDKLLAEMMKFDFEPTDIAGLLMRTYCRGKEVGTEIESGEIISINTGQSIKYNLQGLTSADWVSKNKLGDSRNGGLSSNAVKRLNTIEDLGQFAEIALTFNKDAKYITYGGIVYELEYGPNLHVEQITYARLLAETAAKHITLNPPALEMNKKHRDESIKEGIILRIKSNVSAELRKAKFEAKNIRDLLKAVMKICAVAIKNSIFTSEKDIDSLLIHMSTLNDAYKRVDIGLATELNERFGQISVENLMERNDFDEIIQSLANKAVDEIDRQPSVLDLLL